MAHMNRFVPGIAIGIIAAVSAVLLIPGDPEPPKEYENDFTFYDIELVRAGLEEMGLGLSPPTAITDSTSDQYCSYFREGRQESVSYCTTAAVTDSGRTFGNFNMGGTADGGPVMAVLIAESPGPDPGKVAGVFEVAVESLVCDCWEERRPGGFGTVQDWMYEAQRQFEASDGTVPLKSTISGLDQKDLILEVAREDGFYLWTLLVVK